MIVCFSYWSLKKIHNIHYYNIQYITNLLDCQLYIVARQPSSFAVNQVPS
jgi:hypothetical protein